MTATSGATYTYDNDGNTQTKVVGSNTTTNTWDFENRLTSVTRRPVAYGSLKEHLVSVRNELARRRDLSIV